MKRSFLALIAWASSLHSLPARTYQEVPELAKCFKDKEVAGTFVPFDVATDTMLLSDEARAKKRFTPASTFKIANSFIGLDVGAVKSVDEVLPYGGKPQSHQGMGTRYGRARSDQGIECGHLPGGGTADWVGTDAGRRKEATAHQLARCVSH